MKYLKTFDIKSGEEILKLSVVENKGKVFVEIGPRYEKKNGVRIADSIVSDSSILLSYIDFCRVAHRVEAVGRVFNEYFKETAV